MFGLDNKSGINVMPPMAPADSQTPLWFTEGGAGQSATYPGQDWFNQIQAELLNILKAADIAPQKGSLNQLSSAISKLASAYAISIVHATGQSLTSVMSQKAVTDALGLKFDNKSIVHGTGGSKVNVISQDGATKAFMQIGDHGLGVRAVGDANIPSSTTGAGFYTVGNVGYEDIPPNSVLIRLQGDADRFIGCSTDGKGKLFFKDHASSQLFYLYHPGNVPPSFGIGYKYKDEKNNRKNNTLYTNSTDETIFVSVSSTTTDVNGVLIGTMYVDGINVSRMATGGGGSMTLSKSVSVSAPVPARGTVRVVIDNGDIGYWTEFKKS